MRSRPPALNQDGFEGFRPPKGWRPQPGKVQLVFPPGATVEIDSRYDRAIHMVDAHGVVMGGGAPLLKRVGGTEKLHPCLDPDSAARTESIGLADRARAGVAEAHAAALAKSGGH